MIFLDIISTLISIATGLIALAEHFSKSRKQSNSKKEDLSNACKHIDRSSSNC